MDKIHAMIVTTHSQLLEQRTKAKVSTDFAMPWLTGIRLHALLDCYAALGGDVSPYRNAAGVLKR